MKYLFILTLVFLSHSLAIDLKIEQDKEISISQNEVDWTIASFKAKRFNIEAKDAKSVTYNNRLLANEYLKKHTLPEELKLSFSLSMEEKLSKLYLENLQKDITISDDVIESYYKTKKQDFTVVPVLKTLIFTFKNFDDALTLYTYAKSNLSDIEPYAKQNSLTMVEKTSPLEGFHPSIKPILQQYSTANALTHPFWFENQFIVVYIKEIIPNKQLSFEEAKESIRNILLEKTFAGLKAKTIETLKN
jgi:hypothetical protein